MVGSKPNNNKSTLNKEKQTTPISYQPIRNTRNVNSAKNDTRSPLKKAGSNTKGLVPQLSNVNVGPKQIVKSGLPIANVTKKDKKIIREVKPASILKIDRILHEQTRLQINRSKISKLNEAETLGEEGITISQVTGNDRPNRSANQYLKQIEMTYGKRMKRDSSSNQQSDQMRNRNGLQVSQVQIQDPSRQILSPPIQKVTRNYSVEEQSLADIDQDPPQIVTEQPQLLTESEPYNLAESEISSQEYSEMNDMGSGRKAMDIRELSCELKQPVAELSPKQTEHAQGSQVTLTFDRQPMNILQKSEPLYQLDNDAIIQPRVRVLSSQQTSMQSALPDPKSPNEFTHTAHGSNVAENFKRKKLQENVELFKQEHQKRLRIDEYEQAKSQEEPCIKSSRSSASEEDPEEGENNRGQIDHDQQSRSMQLWNGHKEVGEYHRYNQGYTYKNENFKSSLSPSYHRSKELYLVEKSEGGLVAEVLKKRKIAQAQTRATKSTRVSKMSQHQKQPSFLIVEVANNVYPSQNKAISHQNNRKSVSQILAQGLKEQSAKHDPQKLLEEQLLAGQRSLDDRARNVNLLVSKSLQRNQSAKKRNPNQSRNGPEDKSGSFKNFKNEMDRFENQEGGRVLTGNELRRGKEAQTRVKLDAAGHQLVGKGVLKTKNPPLTANLSIQKANSIQPFGLVGQQLNSAVGTRRTRAKKAHNAPPIIVQKLLTESEPVKNKKFSNNIIEMTKQSLTKGSKNHHLANNTVIISKSPEKASFVRDNGLTEHLYSMSLKPSRGHGGGHTSKTAQSLPRRIQSNFISNINNKAQLNLSQSGDKQTSVNYEQFKNRTGIFLPFTGVEQAFLLRRPQHVRQCTEAHEKLNSLGIGRFASQFSKPYPLWDKQKHRLVYDCTCAHNQPMTDKDVRLYVPPGVRKNGGSHINEKISKYYDKPKSFITPTGPEDTTLLFESRFESGNLGKATQVGDYVYDLELRHDFQSFNLLMTQWYYFRIKNVRKNVEYQFNIVNLYKPDSSYNQGMKPVVYSERNQLITGNGWYRGGTEIKYFQSPNKVKKISGNEITQFVLSFKIKFDFDDDTVFLAHCYPYTYSDLMSYLNRVCNPNKTKDRLKRTQMTRSIAGNSVDMLIITNLESSQDEIAERAAIVISSRVHPGESNASFIMEGIVDFLMSDKHEANLLRDKYVFKIVPMLNPDGVIVGNYRCSLGGYDLNRQWLHPSAKLSPEIHSIKEMIKKTLECRKIELFVDIHGHSRQKDLFIFGCSRNQNGPHMQSIINPDLGNPNDKKKATIFGGPVGVIANGINQNQLQNLTTREKVFPWLLNQCCEDFNYHGCLFGANKAKESTGRVVVWKEFQVQNSYTLECSFCGPTQGQNMDCHFSIRHLIKMGEDFARTILDFNNNKNFKAAQAQVETFYKCGATQISDMKMSKNFSSKDFNKGPMRIENIQQMRKSDFNPILSGTVTQKQNNAIKLEPIMRQKQKPAKMSEMLEEKSENKSVEDQEDEALKPYTTRRRTFTAAMSGAPIEEGQALIVGYIGNISQVEQSMISERYSKKSKNRSATNTDMRGSAKSVDKKQTFRSSSQISDNLSLISPTKQKPDSKRHQKSQNSLNQEKKKLLYTISNQNLQSLQKSLALSPKMKRGLVLASNKVPAYQVQNSLYSAKDKSSAHRAPSEALSKLEQVLRNKSEKGSVLKTNSSTQPGRKMDNSSKQHLYTANNQFIYTIQQRAATGIVLATSHPESAASLLPSNKHILKLQKNKSKENRKDETQMHGIRLATVEDRRVKETVSTSKKEKPGKLKKEKVNHSSYYEKSRKQI